MMTVDRKLARTTSIGVKGSQNYGDGRVHVRYMIVIDTGPTAEEDRGGAADALVGRRRRWRPPNKSPQLLHVDRLCCEVEFIYQSPSLIDIECNWPWMLV